MATAENAGYSATVDMWLELSDQRLEVAQAGDQILFLRHPRELPSQNARLIVKVDGEDFIYDIYLFEGARADSTLVKFF